MFGNPISQSKSPIIHANFAKQFSIELDYSKQLVEQGDFEKSVGSFFSDHTSVGANVTSPFKEEAFNWVDKLSEAAQVAGAINTIIRKDDHFYGENTDGAGLVADFAFNNVELKGKRVLIIGAGGAAKGVLPALVRAQVHAIAIYNRTSARAESLVNDYKTRSDVNVTTYSEAVNEKFDIIINATSLSLKGELPPLSNHVFSDCHVAYDMVYLSHETSFLTLARTQGVKHRLDGLGMLVEQAALSFFHWFNKHPDTSELRRTLIARD